MSSDVPEPTGAVLVAFCDAVVASYTDLGDLAWTLLGRLDKRMETITGKSKFDNAVRDVILTAEREGWWPDLVKAVVDDRPQSPRMKGWAGNYLKPGSGGVQVADHSSGGPVGLGAPVPLAGSVRRLLDIAQFDLEELRQETWSIVREPAEKSDRPLIIFGVACVEDVFVRTLCDWLAGVLGNTERKPNLNLLPEIRNVTKGVNAVVRYRRHLDSASVVCPVLAPGVDDGIVEAFCEGVRGAVAEWRADLAGSDHLLVLVLTGEPGASYPSCVHMLPVPSFGRAIGPWANEVIIQQRWPPSLASSWKRRLLNAAMSDDEGGIDIRTFYEELEATINELRFDAKNFKRRLEAD